MEQTTESPLPIKSRLGRWLPSDQGAIDDWIRRLKKRIAERPLPLVPPIRELRDMVYADTVLHATVAAMFAEALRRRQQTPLGQPEVGSFEEFLELLNGIMNTAPEAFQVLGEGKPGLEPAGFIGFPINALLEWPMSTGFGYDVFANSLVNQQFKKILQFWSKFLVTKESRYVLSGDTSTDPIVIPWLSPPARKEMVDVATGARGEGEVGGGDTFEGIFDSDPSEEFWGFSSWDDFFTRTFNEGVRPVSSPGDDDVVVNACESAPFRLSKNVALSDSFWLKGQPYSLENMLDFDELAPQFEGGTVYQAFLSALSYHRWNSPVAGVVRKAFVVKGSYYLENVFQGFRSPDGPDPVAPNNSQAFLSAVATRAVIFIEAKNRDIGLMCFIAIGMAEVSSNEITVREGQVIEKGEQLGMFHFGGSTHCLVFRPGVDLDFELYGLEPGPNAPQNIRVRTKLATVRRG